MVLVSVWNCLAFLLVAGLALGLVSRASQPFRWPLWVFVATAVVCAGVAALGAPGEADKPQAIRREPSDGFVSSNACRSCHPQQHASWHRSYHRTMTQVVSPATVLAPFAGEVVEHNHERFHFTREDDSLFVEISTGAGAQVESSGKLPIVMSTGSHHLQIYWARKPGPGEPLELVLYWNIAERRWIPKTDTLLTPPGQHGASGSWMLHCIRCHSLNGKPGYMRALDAYDPRVVEFGITCEACHGPGAEHVLRQQNPLRRYREHFGFETDVSMVNPAKLPARASSQICGRCHGSFAMDMERFVTSGFGYKAGEDLERVVTFHDLDHVEARDAEYVRSQVWPDGTTRIGGDEYNAHRKSPCFTAGELRCVSCHSLHQSDPDDQLGAGMRSNQACLQCHEDKRQKLQAHTHHSPDSPGSLCYNCHMPHTSWALSTAMRAHRIDSPKVDTSTQNERPNACNLCHLDKPLSWTHALLSQWYARPSAPLDDRHPDVAASVRWLLSGNAIQRAIAAWHMGWEPALRASGTGWQAAMLAPLLDDPYSQVRFVAAQSLRKQPGFERFDYDFIAPRDRRIAARATALQIVAERSDASTAARSHLRLTERGTLHDDVLQRLQSERDDTPIDVPE